MTTFAPDYLTSSKIFPARPRLNREIEIVSLMALIILAIVFTSM